MSNNPNFIPNMSSDEVYFGQDLETCLTDVVEDKADVSHNHSGVYAAVDHTHSEYASQSDLEMLEDVLDTKSNATHTHSEYAFSTHTHDNYADITALDSLESEIEGKADANHSHTEYASSSHTHSEYAEVNHIHSDYAETTHSHDDYASISHTHTASEIGAADSGHNHDSDYADINHNHDSAYATISHDHDEDYATMNHAHSDYATASALSEVSATVSSKANASHSHDDIYYTETEIDTKLAGKSDSSHTHTGVYDASGSAASALTSANAYTDSKINALVGEGASATLDTIGEISSAIEGNQDAIDLLNSAIANKANATDLTSHANNATIHITSAERNNWNAKSDFSGDYNDLTNKPTIPSVNGLATETYVNTQIDAIVIPDALSDLTADSTHRTVTDTEKAAWNAKSNFSGSYNDLTNKPSIPSISGLATETYVDEVVSTKAESSHIHTIANVSGLQNALNAKSDSTHNHNSSYDVLGAANTALVSAKEYTDDTIADEVDARDSAIATAKSSAISTAASDATTKANNALASAKTYTDSAVATAKNDLLNGAGAAYDTLKELGDLINDNVDAIEALEAVASGKANASHTHTIANVTNLQSTLDGKANTSHGTHVSYSTTAPVMDGTASVGTATTVARSDHRHPTDTSRAAQTSLDSHTSNKSNPHGVTLAQLGVTATASEINKLDGVTATTAELNILDGVTATATELNYVDGVTSNIQTQLNGKAASSHTHNYAGSSSAGGAATSANKLNTNAGSSTQPVYFANGVPVKTTYTLGASVPSGAKFTDTTYSVVTSSANGLMNASDKSKLDGMVLATVSEVETYLGI